MLRFVAEKRRREGIAGGGCDRRQSCSGVYILILSGLLGTHIIMEWNDGIKVDDVNAG